MKFLEKSQFIKFLDSLDGFKKTTLPHKGWIQSMRKSLGMSTRQLSERIDVSTARVQRIEKDEHCASTDSAL